MADKLSDRELGRRARERSKEGVRRLRERRKAEGLAQTTLWLSASARERLAQVARLSRRSRDEVASDALSALPAMQQGDCCEPENDEGV